MVLIGDPTIKDVAKEAGVSVATVSRVINGVENVNEELKKKVETAIKKLGYRPNLLARGLKNKVTHTIGIAIPDLANPFYMTVAKAVESVVEEENYTLFICSTKDDPDKELDYINLLYEKRVDGLIISGTGQNEDYLYQLSKNGLPIVLIDRRPERTEFDAVYLDKLQTTYDLVYELYKYGHRQIALVTGPKKLISNFDRYMGYTKAFYDLELQYRNDLIYFGEFTVEYGQQVLKTIWKSDTIPTAIVSGSSIIAEGIMIAAKEMGVSIPDDLSLVTFGEPVTNPLLDPKLTYAEEYSSLIGKKSGELLLKRIKNFNRKYERIVLESCIVPGNSIKKI